MKPNQINLVSLIQQFNLLANVIVDNIQREFQSQHVTLLLPNHMKFCLM